MIDPTIKALTSAIAQAETGQSSPQAYTKRGASGEYGRYQFMPDTWQAYASEAGVTTPLEQATIEDQNKVAYTKIAKWKAEGYNPAQIASMWNAGPGKPNAYKEGWKGVNEKGVAYDTPAYAQKVSQYYMQMKQNVPEAAAQGPVQPEPTQQEEGGGIGGFLKSMVSAPATMLARPVQAVQSGIQYAATDWKGLEAEAKKYNDEAYRLSLLLKTTPEGYQRDQLKAQIQAQQNLAQQATDRLGKAANWKPSAGGIVAEAPESFADVKKDVGRGIQTAAFGMGPVSGGAAFGAGYSVEQGNDLFSIQTAFSAVLGAAGGKVLDLIGKPLLNASGKVIGKITPEVLKAVAGKGAQAIVNFAAQHEILPKAVSTGINKGADLLERGANAPFKAAGNAVKAPFVQNDEKVIANREKALQDLEEKYAQLRENAARDPKGTAASRARVARSNVLTEEGMINEDGVIIGASRASEAYEKETIGQGNKVVSDLLEREGTVIDIETQLRAEMERVARETFDGAELTKALKNIEKEIRGLRIKRLNGRITLKDAHKNKISSRPKGKDYDDPYKAKQKKAISRAYKETVEKYSKENVEAINKELQKFYDDAEYIASLQGKRIESGKLGKAVARVGGAVTGAVIGGAIGGLPGVAAGSYFGGLASSKLAGRQLTRAFGKPTKFVTPKSKVIGEAVEKANAPRNQLMLPAPSGKTPIPLQAPVGKPSLGAVKAQSYVDRDPKTGKFRKVYLSGDPAEVSKVSEVAYKSTVANGGVTISLDGGMPTKGLAYAPYKGTERIIPQKDFTAKHIETFTQDHAKELAEPGNHLGMWVDDGKVYMDISKVGPDSPETLENAMKASQLAVFNLESFETVTLGEIKNGRYIRTYGKTTNNNAINKGEKPGGGGEGGNGELPKVSGGAQAVGKGGIGKVGESKVGRGEVKGDEYVYHGTSLETLEKIKRGGLEPRNANGTNLTDNFDHAKDFGGISSEGKGMVRIQRGFLPEDTTELEMVKGKLFRTKTVVPPEKLEFSVDGGKTWSRIGAGKVSEIGKPAKFQYKQFGRQLRKQIQRDLTVDKTKAVVVDSDTIKKAHPDYDPANPKILHDESSELSKEILRKAIDEDKTGIFRMTGGGAGSGKSEAVLKRIKAQPSVIFDGVLGNPASAIEKIDYALSKGKRVEIYPVYAPIELATLFNKLRKRSVPDEELVAGHFGFRDTIPQLIAKYGNKIKVKPYQNARFGVKPEKLSQKRKEAKQIVDSMRLSKEEVEQMNKDILEFIDENGVDFTKEQINGILDMKYE